MSLELSNRVRLTLWWITSIATSVICCSFLFVIFGNAIKQINIQMNANSNSIVELHARQDKLLRDMTRLQNTMERKIRVIEERTKTAEPIAADPLQVAPAPEEESKAKEVQQETEGQPKEEEKKE